MGFYSIRVELKRTNLSIIKYIIKQEYYTRMNISRILSTSARRASTITAGSSTTKLSQRGFAIAATQQFNNQQQQSAEYVNNSRALLAAAAGAAAGMTAMLGNDHQTADCCGIAGVVGSQGDAR